MKNLYRLEQGAQIWNEVPRDIKSLSKLKFKKAFQKFLLHKYHAKTCNCLVHLKLLVLLNFNWLWFDYQCLNNVIVIMYQYRYKYVAIDLHVLVAFKLDSCIAFLFLLGGGCFWHFLCSIAFCVLFF